jgi:hypothetical protein
MIKFNEDEKFYRDDNPYSSIAMPHVRRVFPELLASQTVGVVPTTKPQRYIICP